MDDNWTRVIEDTVIESSSNVDVTLPHDAHSDLAGTDDVEESSVGIPVDDYSIGFPDDYEDEADVDAFVADEFEGITPAPDDAAPAVKVKKPKYQPRGMTVHGFRVGSDSATIVDILVAGGLDRQDINDKVAETINTQTRSGRQKNIPSLISGLLARLEERGYMIESNWRVVPPSND